MCAPGGRHACSCASVSSVFPCSCPLFALPPLFVHTHALSSNAILMCFQHLHSSHKVQGHPPASPPTRLSPPPLHPSSPPPPPLTPTETNGRIGYVVVVTGVDRDKWITINKFAVPLRTCTANGTGSGGCLCSYWNLGPRAGENISINATDQCIDAVVKFH